MSNSCVSERFRLLRRFPVFRLLESVSDGAAQAGVKAGSSYCVAADGAKISTALVLETRQETSSVKRCTGSRKLVAARKGNTLTLIILKY